MAFPKLKLRLTRSNCSRVVQARQRIFSGSMDFEVVSQRFDPNKPTTSQVRLKAFFDGEKRRLESFKGEYSYVSVGMRGQRPMPLKCVSEDSTGKGRFAPA